MVNIYTRSRRNPTEAVDTRRRSLGFRTVTSVGALVLTPVSPSARNWRFECSPTLETGCALCGNQTTSTGQTPHKVTPSPLKSESVGRPEAKTTLGVRL